MSGNEMTLLLDNLENLVLETNKLHISLWILIGLLGICAIVIVVFVIPMLIQMKRTLAEAEKTTKTVNTEIIPKVNSMVTEAEPVVNKTVKLFGTVISSVGSIIEGIRFVGNMISRKRNKKEE